MSAAEMMQTSARRSRMGEFLVRYAAPLPRSQESQALENYLRLVSRAYGVAQGSPHLASAGDDPNAQRSLYLALLGQPAALRDFLQMHARHTGSRMLGQGERGNDPLIDILSGLHHRTLAATRQQQPLDVQGMFGNDALEQVPGLRQHVQQTFRHQDIIDFLRQLQGGNRVAGESLDLRSGGVARTGNLLQLPGVVDAAHTMAGQGHAGALNAAQAGEDALGQALQLIQRHRG